MSATQTFCYTKTKYSGKEREDWKGGSAIKKRLGLQPKRTKRRKKKTAVKTH